MARPKKKIQDLKAIRVNVRMTVSEYLTVSENASTLGVSIPDFEARRSQEWWEGLRSLVGTWDEMIEQFNADTGASHG